jgi:hypothetical protein
MLLDLINDDNDKSMIMISQMMTMIVPIGCPISLKNVLICDTAISVEMLDDASVTNWVIHGGNFSFLSL